MADRIYPSAKPIPNPPSAAAAAAFLFTKSQTSGRPAYRPHPLLNRCRRSRRRFCCCYFLWLTLVLLGLIFLAAIAGGVFYVLYRPHRPDFIVSSANLEQFNLTSGGSLTSRLDLVVTAPNPNKKISFLYDPISIAVSYHGVAVGGGSFPAFIHEAKSTTVMKAAVSTKGQSLDSAAADLRRKSRLPLAIDLETRGGVKIGGWKTKRIGIEVSCDGVSVAVPKKKDGKISSGESRKSTSIVR